MTTFINFLSERGFISSQELEKINLEHKISTPKDPFAALFKHVPLSRDQVRAFLGEFNTLPALAFQAMLSKAKNFPERLPISKVEEWKCILLGESENFAEVALVDFENLPLCDEISLFIQKPIKRYVLLETDFAELFEAIYGHQRQFDINDHGSNALNTILENGVRASASDIHLQPQSDFVLIKHRRDGILEEVDKLSLPVFDRLLASLKVQAHMDVGESRKPQHGRYLFPFAGRDVDLRIACHPTINGENVVIRILDKRIGLKSLDQLGFSKAMYNDLKRLSQMPAGMIIFTGPTGSGKTTTLYALLREMDQTRLNIMTLEDPVEYHIEGIRQTEVSKNLTYAQGVRSLLRQDPDVILIGEIRDEETAAMALRASMTGHLVLTTLHTGDAFTVPGRLHDLGVSSEQISAHVLAIVSQRLVRAYCSDCCGKGCDICEQNGYKGRTCLGEYLIVDDKVCDALFENKPAYVLKNLARQTLHNDALDKVKARITSKEEAVRVLGDCFL